HGDDRGLGGPHPVLGEPGVLFGGPTRHLYLPGEGDGLGGGEGPMSWARRWRWLRSTARSCSARLRLNWWEPSFRLTKYRSSEGSGSSTARLASRPGLAGGPGGSPATRYGVQR